MPNWENLPPVKDTGDSLSADELNAIVDGVKKLDGVLDANSNAIQNLPAPVSNNDAARKAYVDTGLSGKANSTHTHSISDVTGLMDAIDGIEGELSLKASLSHTHAISDVTNLQTSLDGKAASSHTHSISDVTGLQDELDAKLETVEITDIEATGTASGTTYLRGDGTWSTPSGGGSSDWGDIGGTLSDQTDLQSALTAAGRRIRPTITIEDPSEFENIGFFQADSAYTVTGIRAVVLGSSSPSVTWTIKVGSSRSSGTEIKTGGTTTTSTSSVTSLDHTSIAADDWVWIETTAQSGTVDQISIVLVVN